MAEQANQNLNSRCGRNRQMYKNDLFALLVMSVIGTIATCACFIGVTYAWFMDVAVVWGNDIESGVMAVEVYNTAADQEEGIVLWDEITEENNVFDFESPEDGSTGIEFYRYVAVVNEGSLDAEYNVGFSVTIPEDSADMAEIIDVFYAFASEEDVLSGETTPAFIYLGKLNEVCTNTNTYMEGPGDAQYNPKHSYPDAYYDEYGNQTIRIKGRLDAAFSPQTLSPAALQPEDETPSAIELHTVDYYCLRLKMPTTASIIYEGASIDINVELKAINLDKELVNITTGTNDEALGLVLGGGTYYQKDEDGKAVLHTIPASGYKIRGWLSATDKEGNPIAEPVQDNEDVNLWYIPLDQDAIYIAEFVKESEFEETEEDNPFGDDEDEEIEQPGGEDEEIDDEL